VANIDMKGDPQSGGEPLMSDKVVKDF